MATIGRKNVHGKGGVRFKAGYTSDKQKNMLRNVVSQLIVSGHVEVTLEFAKRAQKKADASGKRDRKQGERQDQNLLRRKKP